MIFSTSYFPPIEFFIRISGKKEILLEGNEYYLKQTYRNRCNILTNQGVMPLTIPVKKVNGNKTLIKDIEIDFDTEWQSIHLKSIDTAYSSSPFYEFYIEDFIIFFEKKYKYLLDFNTMILEKLFEEFEIEKKIKFTEFFENNYNDDFRNSINPKIIQNSIHFKDYSQVFTQFGFVKNLSVLDLLFNEGTNSYKFLE